MGVDGGCVIFVVFVNFVCFNGSVVAFCVLYDFAVGFVIFLPRWCCALVIVCLFCGSYDLFCGVCCSVCVCVVDCGGPVWGDL